MVCRCPRNRPSWLASAFASTAMMRLRSSALSCPAALSPRRAERGAHRLDIDRVAHHRMIDRERPAPGLRHAEHDDLMVHQLDPGRGAGAAGPQARVRADGSVRDMPPARSRRAQPPTPSELAARERPIDLSVSRVADGLPARFRFGDALRREQRALDLHEMNVGGIGDLRVRHRGATPAATNSTCAIRPSCSGRMTGVCARPIASAGPEPDSSRRSNTVQCGAIAALGAAGHHEADVPGSVRQDASQASASGSAWRTRA